MYSWTSPPPVKLWIKKMYEQKYASAACWNYLLYNLTTANRNIRIAIVWFAEH